MGTTTYYFMGILALSVVALALVFAWQNGRGRRRLSPVAAIALLLVLGGLVYGASEVAGFALMGSGIFLAISDLLVRAWRQE